ncbi:MAG: PucR family transcriptional regulator [Firmicutes bacterium]|nr:PucR family transcriptional regulator [Bacillota bacterium]
MAERSTRRGLRVRDVLRRPLFEGAAVVGGASGLDNTVRWVHVGEVPNTAHFIRGHELVLTTGMALAHDENLAAHYIDELARQRAAAVCLQLGPYWKQPAPAMVEMASRRSLPLIVFPRPVKFVDVCQDVQTLIIGRYYRSLNKLDGAFRQFRKLERSAHDVRTILTLLVDLTGGIALYLYRDGASYAIEPDGRIQRASELARVLDCLSPSPEPDATTISVEDKVYWILHQEVTVLGLPWGRIALVSMHDTFDAEDAVILDHATGALGQVLLREHVLGDYLLKDEVQVVRDLVLGRASPGQVHRFWQRLSVRPSESVYVVAVAPADLSPDASSGACLPIVLAEAMRRRGVRAQTGNVDDVAVAVVVVERTGDNRRRLRQALVALEQASLANGTGSVTAGISAPVGDTDLARAYRQAMNVLSARRQGGPEISPFYEDLGVYSILLNASIETLAAYAREQLSPLLDHDREHHTDLVRTLRTYLNCGGHKNLTARCLFVHRQTLYYRLDQIRSLLGPTFLDPERRLALEVALRAYDLAQAVTGPEAAKGSAARSGSSNSAM